MKKVKGSIFLLFMILLLNSQSLYAKENFKTTIVSDEHVIISFPESCYVLKQEVSEDDPYLALIGASKDYVEEYYKENNIFLHAVASDQSYEIVCTVKDNDNQQYLTDLSLVSDEEIQTLAESMAETYESYGYTDILTDVYSSENEKFAVINFKTSDETATVNCRQFYTILNDKAYYFTLRVFTEEISSDITDIMNEVVDSIEFYNVASQNSSIYENNEYGVCFEIPEGWEKVNANEDNQYLQVQFAQENMLGETFQFYAYDIWSNLDTLRKIMNTRTSLDSTIENADLENLYKYFEDFYNEEADLIFEDFGDARLVYEEEPVLLEHDDVQGNYYKTSYCMLKDGILYVFQYGYYEGSNLHSGDITALLESISLSEPDVLAGDTLAYEEIANFTNMVLAVCIGVVLILIIIIFMYIKSKKTIGET